MHSVCLLATLKIIKKYSKVQNDTMFGCISLIYSYLSDVMHMHELSLQLHHEIKILMSHSERVEDGLKIISRIESD